MDTPGIGVRPIVPVAGRPVVAAATATPKLTYRGGELLTAVQVFTIFWGAAWQQPANSGIVTSINSMFDSILTSSLITLLQEYDVTGKTIGTGTRIGSTTIIDPEPGNGWYDDSNGEIGDICAWQTDTLDGFTVQKEWSNAQKACVVAPASGSLPPS